MAAEEADEFGHDEAGMANLYCMPDTALAGLGVGAAFQTFVVSLARRQQCECLAGAERKILRAGRA